MSYTPADLELAERHVTEGAGRIARQRETVAEHRARGWPIADALALLKLFEDTLEQMIVHRDAIAAQLDSPDS